MDPTQLQTPEEMLDRWDEIECICDPAVGHLCECCHDTQVVRELLKEQVRRRKATDSMIRSLACCEDMEQVRYVLMQCGYDEKGKPTREEN